MHWSEKIAVELIQQNPGKEEFLCAAGISPSGSIHIGNFRDIVTSYFVCLGLRRQGKKARLLFSWDEFDRFRKVPVNVAERDPAFEQYVGKPYVDVPDPFGCCESYAAHFEKEFEDSLAQFGIEVEFRYQAEMYRAGKYKEQIIHSLRRRFEIYDILDKFRTQEATAEERENYYPVSIYCPRCGKDFTTITHLSDDCQKAHYTCACGYEGEWDFMTDYNCKLAWKVDWPMRWAYEQVDFEPGGKDHASPMGSYSNSSIISREIFDYKPPYFQGYEFIGIKGTTGKMSGSTGLNLTPATLLKLYQPEVILWLYSRTEPTHSFDFCFDDEILRQYFEFDKAYNAVQQGTADARTEEIMHNVHVPHRTVETVPMAQLVSLGSVVDFQPQMLETIFEKIGTPYKKEQFSERLHLARYWAEVCSPESLNHLLGGRNWAHYNTLPPEEQAQIAELHAFLAKGGYDLDALNKTLYAIPAEGAPEGDDKAKKARQGTFFKNVYRLLLDKPKGPRLYLFLYAINAQDYLPLLDFSTPETEAEKEARCAKEQQDAASAAVATTPIKPQVGIEDFAKLDVRVCRVTGCEEIPKSKNCLKLAVFDGAGTRTIVSSIKDYYQPADLVGKKILVVVNLKPAKLAGQLSEGMLLAAEGSFGCSVLFADDAIPEGTPIS